MNYNNLPPDNETVEDGGGCYVAGSREERPDFPQWIETEAGKGCLQWPISEVKYLRNRLFWAFDAGRNCVWDQYINQKAELTSLRSELQQVTQEKESTHTIHCRMLETREKTISKLASELQQAKYDNENAWKGVKEVCAQKYELECKLNELKEQLKKQS